MTFKVSEAAVSRSSASVRSRSSRAMSGPDWRQMSGDAEPPRFRWGALALRAWASLFDDGICSGAPPYGLPRGSGVRQQWPPKWGSAINLRCKKLQLSMSLVGQNAKYSSRVDVFRFAPESGHRAMQSACPFRARFGRLVSEPHSFIETNKQHEKRISRTLIGRTFPNGISIQKIRLRADRIAVILALSARLPEMDDRHHRSSPEIGR
jgi:hypothetical protein